MSDVCACSHDMYRDDLFEQMLQEPDEVATKRKRTRDMLRVLQQAFRVSFAIFHPIVIIIITLIIYRTPKKYESVFG